MNKIWKPLLLISLFFSLSFASDQDCKTTIQLGLEKNPTTNDKFVVATVTVEEGWKMTADKPSDEFAYAATSELTHPGVKYGQAQWPKPLVKYIEVLDMDNEVFEGTFKIHFPILSKDKEVTEEIAQASAFFIDFQVCNPRICLPPEKISAFTWIGGVQETQIAAAAQPVAENEEPVQAGGPVPFSFSLFFTMLGFAFVGGLILNVMPCVLPVLSLKIFSLMKQAGENRSTLIKLGFAYTLGVFVSFWILAGITIALKEAGEMVGWGFQFQSKGFLLFMAVILAVFAMNLFGLFEIYLPTGANTKMNQAASKSGLTGSFFNGALMTLLATPCMAPYLGSAMGFAFSQTNTILFVMFSMVAFGLALPFLLLSFFPKAMKFIPKPGDWMLRVKEFMGFLLLGTLIWILSVLNTSAGFQATMYTLIFLLFLCLACWVYGKFITYGSSTRTKYISLASILAIALGSYAEFGHSVLSMEPELTSKSEVNKKHVDFSPEKLEEYRQTNQAVFLDFGAEWCVTCKVNEKGVLYTDEIQQHFKDNDVIFMYGDYTRKDDKITQVLKKYNRAGVPFYIFYPESGPPVILSELLTKEEVKKVTTKDKVVQN